MEKNLNVAPTEQELYNAGFKKRETEDKSVYMVIELSGVKSGWAHKIKTDLETCHLWIDERRTMIDFTKQKINDAFALFNQPLPQWEKPTPKVGEVWGNEWGAFLVVQSRHINIEKGAIDLEGKDKGFVFDLSWKMKGNHTKLYNSLEDYYNEKLLKKTVT